MRKDCFFAKNETENIVKDISSFLKKLEKFEKSDKKILKQLSKKDEELEQKDLEIKRYKDFYYKINNEIYMDAYDERCSVDERELYKMLKKDIKKYLEELKSGIN